MPGRREDRARTAGPSSCPERLRSVDVRGVVPDLILALIVTVLGLAIITDPPGGLVDGRHLLAGVAVLTLIARTNRAARR